MLNVIAFDMQPLKNIPVCEMLLVNKEKGSQELTEKIHYRFLLTNKTLLRHKFIPQQELLLKLNHQPHCRIVIENCRESFAMKL
jgi:hypothetical protein